MEALNKWDGGCAPGAGRYGEGLSRSRLTPPQFLGSENIGTNLCNLVQFGVLKITILNRNIEMFTSYQLVD